MNTSEEKKNSSLIKFIGFGGIVVLMGFAVQLGRYEDQIEGAVVQGKATREEVKEIHALTIAVIDDTHVQKYRVNMIEKRLDNERIK